MDFFFLYRHSRASGVSLPGAVLSTSFFRPPPNLDYGDVDRGLLIFRLFLGIFLPYLSESFLFFF